MKKASLTPNIVVDCSHANSDKKADNQAKVLNDLVHQINNGEESIVGVMIESNLKHGNQKVKDIASIKPGVSITDECIGWEETEQLILNMHSSLK
jgi:3-deoxy-7-phosphoheptulonate synthase